MGCYDGIQLWGAKNFLFAPAWKEFEYQVRLNPPHAPVLGYLADNDGRLWEEGDEAGLAFVKVAPVGWKRGTSREIKNDILLWSTCF